MLAALLDTLRVPWRVEPAQEPFLHPGRSARVLVGADARAGRLARRAAPDGRRDAWDLDGAVAGFELDLGAVLDAAPERCSTSRT